MKTKHKFTALFIPLSTLFLLLPGCAWVTSHKSQIDQTTTVAAASAVRIGTQLAEDVASGSNGQFNHSIALGLRSEIPNIVTSSDVARIVRIWGHPSPQTTAAATALAEAYRTANPKGKSQTANVIEALASGLQSAATPKTQP